MQEINWISNETPEEIQKVLTALSGEYSILKDDQKGITVEFKKSEFDDCRYIIKNDGNKLIVEYSRLNAAIRAVGSILSGVDSTNEQTSFETFGVMLDCSRNAVIKVEHLKEWLRKLALLGYNMVMLYTEDTYILDGEPYFGYQRGAYTADELREIDDYAYQLGIEMVPCIQTLGHFSQVLKWPCYDDITDAPDVMMVRSEKTHKLIEKMIKHCAEVFRTKRIHIGMDETHNLGRGKFMDQNGYENAFGLFNEHLAKVNSLCSKYELKPMIWSDMYFRLGSKTQDYYDKDNIIPDEVKQKIPTNVELVYWDYYHKEKEFYSEWIERHRDLGFNPIMASGIWTWGVLSYSKTITDRNAIPCIKACREQNLKEFFFTLWNDDASFCDYDSSFAGLTSMADYAFSGETDTPNTKKRFANICFGDYDICVLPDLVKYDDEDKLELLGCELFWDDPLMGIAIHNVKAQNYEQLVETLESYKAKLKQLKSTNISESKTYNYRYSLLLMQITIKKLQLRLDLESAYKTQNMEALEKLIKESENICGLIDEFDSVFREMWLSRNKPFGLDVIQVRLAGLIRRHKELAHRITELKTGKINVIEELENMPEIPFGRLYFYYKYIRTSTVVV